MRSYVIDRHGNRVKVRFDRITDRVEELSNEPYYGRKLPVIDPEMIAKAVIDRFRNGMTTTELDELTIGTCREHSTESEDYEILAARLAITGIIHKVTPPGIRECVSMLRSYGCTQFSNAYVEIIDKYYERIDRRIDHKRDFRFKYFGVSTLLRYLITAPNKASGSTLRERPQHMYMRVALTLFFDKDNVDESLEKAFALYDLLSTHKVSCASPILLNSGTTFEQRSSCFTGDTEVFVVNRGVVPISEVALGDRVVTHTGEVQTVSQLHKNPLGDRRLHSLQMMFTPELKVTDNHRLMAITAADLAQGLTTPSWKPVGELGVGDYIAVPRKEGGVDLDVWDVLSLTPELDCERPNGEVRFTTVGDQIRMEHTYSVTGPQYGGKTISITNARGNLVNRYWVVDDNFAWFLGVWLGDGCVAHGKTRKGATVPQNIQIVSSKDNTQLISKVSAIGERVFGFAPSISYNPKQNLVQIVWSSTLVALLFKHMFGCGFEFKTLNEAMYAWDASLVRALLGGLISSDGCVTSTGQVIVSLSNYPMLKSFYHLARSVGVMVGFREVQRTHGENWKYKPVWSLTVNAHEEVMAHVVKHYTDGRLAIRKPVNGNKNFITLDDSFYVKVVSNKPIVGELPEYVYTLGVDEDHSYNVEGIVAENCFLLGIGDDLTSIFDTLKSTALISKRAGGIGFHLSSVRAENALIRSTGGKSCGIKNFIRLFHECQMTVNQGGLRPGAFAVYMEPWHADIFRFLVDLPRFRKERADTAPNLKYALWIPDNFMRALINGTPWYLLSPDECPGLNATWGKEYEELYDSYVQKGLRGELKIFKKVSAEEIAREAYRTIRETGTPYLCFKDNFNKLSNMQNVATIASSNLCAEISIPSWSEHDAPLFGHEKSEVGVCNLGSIVVAEFVGDCTDGDGECIDYAGISAASGLLAEALDNVIDRNYYPVEAAERSNKRHRPIGIGMLGLADVFAMLKIVYGSREAQQIDAAVMSAIYYGSVKKSAELAKLKGAYPSFDYNGGCPASRGLLQPDLWVANGYLQPGWEDRLGKVTGITADDWDYLRAQARSGLRNSYLTACMPTASTAIMVARNESFEPFTSNLYARNTLSGEFLMVNRYLLRELMDLGLWTHELRMQLISNRGSVQDLNIPDDLKLRYRTAQEMDQRLSVMHSAARGPFVCQSQSLNFFYRKPQFKDILTIMRDGWRRGLKTGAYYHHSDDGNTSFKSAVVGSVKSVKNIEEAMEATAQALQKVAISEPAPVKTEVKTEVAAAAPMPALNADDMIAFACPRGKGGPGCEACSG